MAFTTIIYNVNIKNKLFLLLINNIFISNMPKYNILNIHIFQKPWYKNLNNKSGYYYY